MRIIFLAIFVSISAFGHGGGAEKASVGKGKGVEYYDEHEGFILSPQAIKRIGIQTAPLSSGKDCDLKPGQRVFSLGKRQVFVVRDGKYFSIPMECKAVKSGDLLVTKGADFLRVIEMDLKSGEEAEEEGGEHQEGSGHHDDHEDDHEDEHGHTDKHHDQGDPEAKEKGHD